MSDRGDGYEVRGINVQETRPNDLHPIVDHHLARAAAERELHNGARGLSSASWRGCPFDAAGQRVARRRAPSSGGRGTGLIVSSPPAHAAARATSATLAPRASLAALPASVDISRYNPPVGNQGGVNSCASWATGYYLRGWYAKRDGYYPASAPESFAPMFLYSLANNGVDQGSAIPTNIGYMEYDGIDTRSDYAQGDYDWWDRPTSAEMTNASRFPMTNFSYTYSPYNNPTTTAQVAIESQLAGGDPVVLGFPVYPEFDHANAGNPLVLPPTAGETSRGLHAVFATKYDANGLWVENQWGTGWGLNGWAELSWSFVNQYTQMAVKAAPITPSNAATATNTPIPTTATNTNTPIPTTATNTNTPIPTTATNTNTPIPPTTTATNTPIPPTTTATNTNTPVPPTATTTNTPTQTARPATATSTPTNTAIPPTRTNTPPSVPATATTTNTPVPPTATSTPTSTSTYTPVPPANTNTPVPPTATDTNTPVPPTATDTNTPVPPTNTSTPVPPTRTNTPPSLPATATVTPTAKATVTDGGAQTIFTRQAPSSVSNKVSSPRELGTKFTATVSGRIQTIRYWKARGETGAHIGHIWGRDGALLATARFIGESATGWQQATLSTPLAINANTTYVVSVNVNQYYVDTRDGLRFTVTHDNLQTVADGRNGVYGANDAFPTNAAYNDNYFRDVVFTPAGLMSVQPHVQVRRQAVRQQATRHRSSQNAGAHPGGHTANKPRMPRKLY